MRLFFAGCRRISTNLARRGLTGRRADFRNHQSIERYAALSLFLPFWVVFERDGLVPEEFEFTRRKPVTQWEGVCQHYEHKLLQALETLNGAWISGAPADDVRTLSADGGYRISPDLPDCSKRLHS